MNVAKNIVIDTESQHGPFGPFSAEKVETTLTLFKMESGKFGIGYNASYSGVKSGKAGGGPFEVDGNMTKTVHTSPTIVFQVSDWSGSDSQISMRAKISVDYLGSHTLFDKTLKGAVPDGTYLQDVLGALTTGIKAASEASPA